MVDSKRCSGVKIKAIKNQNVREMLAEALGTFMAVIYTTAAACQMTLGGSEMATYLSVNVSGGIGVAMGVYVCGNVSGGAVNPAVSVAFCLTKRTPWRRLPFHWLGQLVGAYTASAVTYGVYRDALDAYDGGSRHVSGPKATAGLFASIPRAHTSTLTGLLDQISGTVLLIVGILAIIDPRGTKPHKGLAPLLSGLLVTAIGAAFGLNCDYPVNPARDLGPRLLLLTAGWGTEVFSYRDYNWFWVPIVGPLVGGVLGTFLYYVLVAFHWPGLEDEDGDRDGDMENTNRKSPRIIDRSLPPLTHTDTNVNHLQSCPSYIHPNSHHQAAPSLQHNDTDGSHIVYSYNCNKAFSRENPPVDTKL